MPLASGRIFFLDSMRAIAIVMVVGVHSLGYSVALPLNQKEIISFIVHTISVPVFFLVDGYLFARSVLYSKNQKYLEYLRRSIFRLLIPWTVFTSIYTFARYIFEYTGFLKEKLILDLPWQKVVIFSYGSVYAPQMYFLFSLFLIRIFCPVSRHLFIRINYFVMLSLFFSYFFAYKSIVPFISPHLKIAGGQEPILHALWGMQFYIVGIVIFRTSEIIDIQKLFIPFLLFFIFAFFIQDKLGSYGSNLIQYLYLVVFFLFFTFFRNGVSPLNFIGKITMGIYLIHCPIILKSVSLILNKFIHNSMLSYLSILFVTLILTIFVVMLINVVPHGPLLFGTPLKKLNRIKTG